MMSPLGHLPNCHAIDSGLAVACVTLAGVFASMSLFLPYWSKITIASAVETNQLELTFGIWGSCLTIQVSGAPSSNTSSSPRPTRASKAATSFTCASYYDTEVVGLRCTDLPGVSDGDYSCERVTNDEGKSLCASSTPLALLLTDADNSIESRVATEWRSVVQSACSSYGHVSVGLAFTTAVLTALSFVLLATGITCGSIESCIARAGSATAIVTAMLQGVLGLIWHLEARAATDAAYGSSYYLNAMSAVLLATAFVAGRTHTQLGREAQKMLELDFVMSISDDKPSLQRDTEGAKAAVGPLPTTQGASASVKTSSSGGVSAV